jgi:hypothetical protein
MTGNEFKWNGERNGEGIGNQVKERDVFGSEGKRKSKRVNEGERDI